MKFINFIQQNMYLIFLQNFVSTSRKLHDNVFYFHDKICDAHKSFPDIAEF